MSSDGGPSQIVGWQKNREFVKLGIVGVQMKPQTWWQRMGNLEELSVMIFFHKVVTGENLV